MADINTVFPSKYLKATDFDGHDAHYLIERFVVKEKVGRDEDEVPVIYFQNERKGMILNRTNGRTISGIHGPETDNWPGKTITLYPTEVEFGGQTTLGIRVRMTAPSLDLINTDGPLTEEPPF